MKHWKAKSYVAGVAVGDMSKYVAFGVLGEKTGLKKPKEFYEENDNATIVNQLRVSSSEGH
ncbi:hypothetical protein NXW94_30255 [Bacteroides ovatus]|nr:hypothetical protein [Bacteroides ovatus]